MPVYNIVEGLWRAELMRMLNSFSYLYTPSHMFYEDTLDSFCAIDFFIALNIVLYTHTNCSGNVGRC